MQQIVSIQIWTSETYVVAKTGHYIALLTSSLIVISLCKWTFILFYWKMSIFKLWRYYRRSAMYAAIVVLKERKYRIPKLCNIFYIAPSIRVPPCEE